MPWLFHDRYLCYRSLVSVYRSPHTDDRHSLELDCHNAVAVKYNEQGIVCKQWYVEYVPDWLIERTMHGYIDLPIRVVDSYTLFISQHILLRFNKSVVEYKLEHALEFVLEAIWLFAHISIRDIKYDINFQKNNIKRLLTLDWLPWPHVTLHCPLDNQAPQLPLTISGNWL